MDNTQAFTARTIDREAITKQLQILPQAATMKGDLSATAPLSLRLDGSFEGSITLPPGSTVHFGPSAKINVGKNTTDTPMKIEADNVLIEGCVEGEVIARKVAEIAATAQVTGSVTYGCMDLHPGARLNAKVTSLPANGTGT